MIALPLRPLALAVALAGCPSAPRTTDAPAGDAAASAPQPKDTVAATQPQGTRLYSAVTSGLTAPEQLVLRDAGAWRAAWARLHEGMVPPALPAVDFARDMVVVLALGERSSGGHQVRFDAIVPSGADATVRYTVTEPGPNCMTTQAITAPVEVVRVPRVAGTVRFEPRTVRQSC